MLEKIYLLKGVAQLFLRFLRRYLGRLIVGSLRLSYWTVFLRNIKLSPLFFA